ncbi:MAG: type II toxin-antitoxin system RelE/ParE family toxin [Methylobacter sp.]|nr:type II toxin-antitoxin system RelE/ParE family toxin [Methylobacter sp.]MDP2098164.1 type II toxin-antitoxin system RelE/ParE family toxin [Methylobacter sp.]MDP2429329.1 type II toxin-antitoxin system RelE/ParE family toxin [Methylobacter sp.]MDP3055040.1 type II toxin-antitoxin system RelE/ParE family toxin [Methylobacter sp.]MDP3364170.1 type II toxin-antitoxin system RelE/ParE family toxin [Methylobacter sp.]
MIKTFRHKGLEAFFKTGSKAGIQLQHAGKLRVLLTTLDNAKQPNDMNAPNWRLHPLTGNLNGHYAVTVNGNWRITFSFVGDDVELVDYLDYH